MGYENNEKKIESVHSVRVKAGKRRTYFFDVRETKGNDFFVTITESRKRFEGEGYDRHKIFLYKEDFNKFIAGLNEAVDHVKTELMPDFDFDSFSHDENWEGNESSKENIGEEKVGEDLTAYSSAEQVLQTGIDVVPPMDMTTNTETSGTNSDNAGSEDLDSGDKNDAQHEEADKW